MKRRLPRRRPPPQRGFTLIDALIALALLAFGLLGMTRLQTRALAQATEAQSRTTAAQLGDELISSVLVDTANRNCYTLPASGACGSTVASALAANWKTRVQSGLKSGSATSTYDATTGRMRVVISWVGKGSGETRSLEATTDVR
ncbi:MAG: type IV pilus modification protein PilV [Rubrivivax sp.]